MTSCRSCSPHEANERSLPSFASTSQRNKSSKQSGTATTRANQALFNSLLEEFGQIRVDGGGAQHESIEANRVTSRPNAPQQLASLFDHLASDRKHARRQGRLNGPYPPNMLVN